MLKLLSIPLLLCLLLRCSCEEVKLKGHLEPFGKQGPTGGVDEVQGFVPPQQFINDYVLKSKPLLFKGAAKLSPAFSKWTDQNLKEQTPPRPAGDVFIEHNKKENRSQVTGFIHFAQFLDTYNASNIYMVSDVPSFIVNDLVLPFSLQCEYFIQGGLDTHVAWFSSGGTASVIHYDTYENINCLYRGRKRLVLVDSRKYKEEVRRMIDKSGFSSADVDKIDLKKRPEFGKVDFHVAEVHAGDCLYIPHSWVHQVRSFESNLAVNIWWNKQEKYDLKNCSKEYNTNITFNEVFFKVIERQAREDIEQLIVAAISNMQLNNYESSDQFLKLVSEGNSKVAKDAKFKAATKTLFDAMDLNKDAKLNADDILKKKMKKKQYQPIKQASDAYNVAVYRIREELSNKGEKGEKLPKFFSASINGHPRFAANQSWPLPGYDEENYVEGNEEQLSDYEAEDNEEDPSSYNHEDAIGKDEL